MNNALTITLRTLTPLWTGGMDTTMDRVHETGIIGSLRWWYEAIVRGLGGKVCDPSEHGCQYDPEKPNSGLCLGCQLFGATGWKRRFRLMIIDQTHPHGLSGRRQTTGDRYKRSHGGGAKQRPSWYFGKVRAGDGDLTLQIIPTAADFNPILIEGTLALIARWGSLGARPQLGYGWIKLLTTTPLNTQGFVQAIGSLAASQPGPKTMARYPSLDNMFFAHVKAPDKGITATLNLKYDLRAAFRASFGSNQKLRHWVCGYVRGDNRQASKISISQEVGGRVRVWGWIPYALPVQGITRDPVMKEIKSTLATYGEITDWREFNSARDTTSQYTDMKNFLTSLLEEQP